jgi:hypothetical protein
VGGMCMQPAGVAIEMCQSARSPCRCAEGVSAAYLRPFDDYTKEPLRRRGRLSEEV